MGIVFVLLLLASLLSSSPAAAAGDIDDALAEVVALVTELATAVIRLMVVVGVGFFVLGVVRGAFDGVLGSTIGSAVSASTGLLRAVGATIAFLALLFSVGFSRSFVQFLADRLLDPAAMEIPSVDIPDGPSAPPAGSVTDALQLEAVQDTVSDFVLALVRVMIGVGVALFAVGTAAGAFDAQLGHVVGNSLAVSRGYMRIVGAAAAVLFLLLAMPLSRALVEALVPRLLEQGIQIPSVLP
jgi:hypothetical protein